MRSPGWAAASAAVSCWAVDTLTVRNGAGAEGITGMPAPPAGRAGRVCVTAGAWAPRVAVGDGTAVTAGGVVAVPAGVRGS